MEQQRRFIVKSVSLTGTVEAGATQAFLSTKIPTRHRPLLVTFWPSVSADGSWFSIFLTKAENPVIEPQVGDPPVIFSWQTQFPGTNLLSIPLVTAEVVDEGVRVNVVVRNNATSALTFTMLYVYQEVP